jgi:hypothetical protein
MAALSNFLAQGRPTAPGCRRWQSYSRNRTHSGRPSGKFSHRLQSVSRRPTFKRTATGRNDHRSRPGYSGLATAAASRSEVRNSISVYLSYIDPRAVFCGIRIVLRGKDSAPNYRSKCVQVLRQINAALGVPCDNNSHHCERLLERGDRHG